MRPGGGPRDRPVWGGHRCLAGRGALAPHAGLSRFSRSLSQRFCKPGGWGSAPRSGMRFCRGCGGRGREGGRTGWAVGGESEQRRERGGEGWGDAGPPVPSPRQPLLGSGRERAGWERAVMGSGVAWDGAGGEQHGKPWGRPDAPVTGSRDRLYQPTEGGCRCRTHVRPPPLYPAVGAAPTVRRCPRVSQPGHQSGLGEAPLCASRKWFWKGARRHTLCLREAGKR